MKRILSILLGLSFLLAGTATAEIGQISDEMQKGLTKEKTVHVYYFHSSRRCKTCLSIERISRGIIKDQYGDNNNVEFKSINIEEDTYKKLVEEYEIAGSALLVCCGKEKVDLTAKAFQYALSSPQKLQNALITSVDKFLK